MSTTTMGKFDRKFKEYNRLGRWGGRTYGFKKRTVYSKRKATNWEWNTITFVDTIKLDMRQEDNQSAMIYMAMKIGDDYDELQKNYHKLQKNYDKFRALYINRSDDYSVLEGKNASLQNQVETLKKRLRLANERHFNRQFENHNNTK